MECKNKKNNLSNCTCTYVACSRRGYCCECVSYHLSHNEIPGCFFSKEAEKTYDRSLANFLRDKKKK